MSARDFFHNAFCNALIKDGWRITHDPYTLAFGEHDLFVDLGAERPLAAEKGDVKIAAEIKSFISASEIRELETALGQFVLYRVLIQRKEPDRKLYLALPDGIFESLLAVAPAQPLFEDLKLAVITFDPAKEEIVRWKT